ncbi:hypothetical protein I4U23_012157 [Adineta vaga]|nr:hypothetical protein I4U23_012157 [Adineta vaga]
MSLQIQFYELQFKNISISMVLHQYNSSVTAAEQYAHYLKNSNQVDDYLCECTNPKSFGTYCEYLLFEGTTFAETLSLQTMIKENNLPDVQFYGKIVCYETLKCYSGLLCLDWRDICDGLQQCMFGLDEEHCDKLEYNECEDDEYRCMNGMCIPEEYFLDGQLDCLDWSDEIAYYDDLNCAKQSASMQCDDRICPPYEFSCGDGQCISDRFDFQIKQGDKTECRSRREQFFICETHYIKDMWTLSSGRCFEGHKYEESTMINRTCIEECQYILLCDLAGAIEANCPCGGNNTYCNDELRSVCSSNYTQYPKEGIMAPYVLFMYPTNYSLRPSFMWINGTIKCDGIATFIPGIELIFNSQLRQVQEYICQWARNRSSSNNHSVHQCYYQHSLSFNNHPYNMTNICNNSTTCVSLYRIKDGFMNCLDNMDEMTNISVSEICSHLERYRFRCSVNEPTCLTVNTLGNHHQDCTNKFDELWFGTKTKINEIRCNAVSKDQCQMLRQYIEKSWTTDHINEVTGQYQIPFHYYCDTFWDLGTKDDENLIECKHRWICSNNQWQCNTGQCIDEKWVLDGEWDCSDGSDEELVELMNRFTTLNTTIPFSKICNLKTEFPCLVVNISESVTNFTRHHLCISRQQIGDDRIDCYGGIDERNRMTHCDQSTMLGYDFKCNSNVQCIPYRDHCFGQRCENSLDDHFWCHLRQNLHSCYNFSDAVCFNKECIRQGRCNGKIDCLFGEDEYMCEHQSVIKSTGSHYRQDKEIGVKKTERKLQLIHFPTNSNITKITMNSTSVTESLFMGPLDLISTRIIYECNRGIGIRMHTNSIACFCPPQYYGDRCEFHTDRIIVLLHLNYSESIYAMITDDKLVLKILVLLLFNNETIANHLFHSRPTNELHTFSKKTIHFLYSRATRFLLHKQQRYENHSNIINEQPYSIRIEIYERQTSEMPLRIAVWQYPIYFDYLPVFRFAKVLRFSTLTTKHNPCSNNPCNNNQECYPLLNERSKYICLCKSNFTGENCSIENQICTSGYCSFGSICKPDYQGVLLGNQLPYCICPFNRFGERCYLTYDQCIYLNRCKNNGTCFPASKPDSYQCLCTDQYYGRNCHLKKSETTLHINKTVSYSAAVIQYFDIDFLLMNLVLAQQEVYQTLPAFHYYRHTQNTAPELILIKLYSQEINVPAEIYLLSVHIDVTSISATTQIIEQNRCVDVHSLISDNITDISDNYFPIIYHNICQKNENLLCFKDDVYLCICSEEHNRVDCFTYDKHLDQCFDCLTNGRCIKGNRTQMNHFLCLCPPCYSGARCQFNSNSFAFTLDQLFFVDLTSTKSKILMYLLIIFSIIMFLIALPNNIFSFMTFRRQKCLSSGIGQYLFCMSVVNQINICVLVARLIHLTVIITGINGNQTIDNILCKVLNYSLTCSTRMVYWLVSFVAVDRVYTVVFLRGQWLKKPYIARRLLVLTFTLLAISGAYELTFMKVIQMNNMNSRSSMCVIELPLTYQNMWIRIHQIVSILNFILPLVINICCTITIIYIIIQTKMNIRTSDNFLNADTGEQQQNQSVENNYRKNAFQISEDIKTKETRYRFNVLRDVLNDHKEMIARPAVTLVPSMFSLFSMPIFIASFSLGCQNLENNPIRYLLIVLYFISFIPQMITFFLYVYPSSLYFNEWRLTNIGQRLSTSREQSHQQNTALIYTIKEEILDNAL